MSACIPSTFSPSLFGAEILSLNASLVTNYSAFVPAGYRFTSPSTQITNATFCNVTIVYTHPGQNDNIIVEAWLPAAEDWNERFLAEGGGGWGAGRFLNLRTNMDSAIADGFATVTTDAGLGIAPDPSGWALNSPGNVNLYNLQNLASVSLEDEALIGKSLIKSFYGRDPKYSYWNGCSQGGRQGLMLAQRYPTLYDGIAAGAPAIHWHEVFESMLWPQQFMNMLGEYPYGCEIEALTAAAVSACDVLDGVTDGIIGEVELCLSSFDPFHLVGTTVGCTEKSSGTIQISLAAAAVVNASWHGITTAEGKRWWYGVNPGTNLVDFNGVESIATTNCTEEGCIGIPSSLALPWLRFFVAKDPDFNFANLTQQEFDRLLHLGLQEYKSIIGTDDADLSEFRNAGGKMVTFHGLADPLIPTKGSEDYYNSVGRVLPDVEEFYRLYQIPGLGHCFGGPSSAPMGLFEQLRAWVENGTAPGSTPVQVTDLDGTVQNRIVCPYPQVSRFDVSCGDVSVADCWFCVGELSVASDSRFHSEL